MGYSPEKFSSSVDSEELRRLFSRLTTENRVDHTGRSAPLVDMEDSTIVEQLEKLESALELELFILPCYWLSKETDSIGKFKQISDTIVFHKDTGYRKVETNHDFAEHSSRKDPEIFEYTFDGATVLQTRTLLEKGSLKTLGRQRKKLTQDDILEIYSKFSGPNIISYDEFVSHYLPSGLK